MTATCQAWMCFWRTHENIVRKQNKQNTTKTIKQKSSGVFVRSVASRGWRIWSPAFAASTRVVVKSDYMTWCGSNSLQTALPFTPSVNKQFLLKQQLHRQTGEPAWRLEDGCFAIRPLRTLSQSCHLTSYTAICLRGMRSFIRMWLVTVLIRRARKVGSIAAANCRSGSPSVVSVWTDMWTLGVLQKQESEGKEALWLAGWLAGLVWRERRPSRREEEVHPGLWRFQVWTLQDLLWRWSQTVQLPLIQAFPVLEVVVQVLHKIREVCKRWGEDTGSQKSLSDFQTLI